MYRKALTSMYRNSNGPPIILAIPIWVTMAASCYLYMTMQDELVKVPEWFTLHSTDLLFALLSVYCLAGVLLTRWRWSAEIILLLLYALLTISFIRGALGFLSSAGVEFRIVAVFVALILFIYFWGHKFQSDWISWNIVVLGWAIVALSAARLVLGWDAFILGRIDPFSYLDPNYGGLRTLNGAAAFMLGQAALITFNKAFSEGPITTRSFNWLTLVIFVLTLLISQQRTAIFATLTGLAVIVAFPPTRYRAVVIVMGSFVIVGCSMILLAAWIDLGGDKLVEYFPSAIRMIIFQQTTFGSRVLLWSAYLNNYETWPIVERLLGRPFGIPILAFVTQSQLVEVSPHNGYIVYLLRIGLVGLLVFIAALIYALGKSLYVLVVTASRGNPSPPLRLGAAVVASQAIFSLTYLLPNEQGLLLAVAFQTISEAFPSFARISLMRSRELSHRLGRASGASP